MTAYTETIGDNISTSDGNLVGITVFTQDSTSFTDYAPMSYIHYLQYVIDSASISDSNAVYRGVKVVELIDYAEIVSGYAAYNIAASDSMSISDDASYALTIIVSVDESIDISSVAKPSAFFTAIVKDNIVAGVVMLLGGDVFTGVAVNARNFASTRYENFNFNSFALFDGKYWGLSNDSLCVLEGDNDNGEIIQSRITTGNINVARGSQARVEDAYLICKNDGDVIVRVFANGEKYDYRLTKASEFLDESRVKLGKGRKAAVWQFELESDAGSTFDVDSVKIYPLALSRRV